ncbi:hypothetical protein CNR22_16665 [Sphingobacteriaceae bacterium]|nr:hypothetical protein CNR22_16665 [Sphingobacteriaceae bacterium]
MSSHKDNTHKHKLKELLNKKTQQDESFDAFDQDALEGFAMLENEKEAFDLQNRVDAKLFSEVFNEEKKSVTGYWYAAAGLFLVIGFSIYLFLKTSSVKEDQLAIESSSGDKLQKSMEERTLKNRGLQFEAQDPSQSAGQVNSENAKPVSESETAPEAPMKEGIKSSFKDDQKTITSFQIKTAPKPMSAPASEKNEVLAPVEQMNQGSDMPAVAKAEETKKIEESDSEKEVVAGAKDSKKLKSTEGNERSGNYMSPPSAASSDAGAAIALPEISDEAAFKKELKEALVAKNLVGKFDVSLMLDEKGKVKKAVFTNAFDFTRSQQKEITQVLTDLKSLKFKTSSSPVLQQYNLVYRP